MITHDIQTFYEWVMAQDPKDTFCWRSREPGTKEHMNPMKRFGMEALLLPDTAIPNYEMFHHYTEQIGTNRGHARLSESPVSLMERMPYGDLYRYALLQRIVIKHMSELGL